MRQFLGPTPRERRRAALAEQKLAEKKLAEQKLAERKLAEQKMAEARAESTSPTPKKPSTPTKQANNNRTNSVPTENDS